MEFINREEELRELRRLRKLSKRKLFVVALYGLRRVGKTRLLLEFIGKQGLYFFVNRNKTSSDLLLEFQGILRDAKALGELEVIDSWDTFIELLIKRDVPPVVFDEFQNFDAVEASVFGILQKNIDLNEERPGLIILSGSLIGLMKRLFRDAKEPLYGRVKQEYKIRPLSLKSCIRIGEMLGMNREELIKFYCIFGGFPKYYVVIEDFGLEGKTTEDILEFLLFNSNAPLEDEVNSVLAQEFGSRRGVYYSILKAIAQGKNTLSLIAGTLNMAATSITRQLNELKDYFELIEMEMPFEGKRGIYRITHPLIEYWFSEIYRHYSDYVARRPEFMEKLKANLNTYYGRAFERVAKEFVVERLKLSQYGRQWGKIRGEKKGKNTYEIDLIGKGKRKIFAFEFKWAALTAEETERVLNDLRRKVMYMREIPDNMTFGIVAKRIDEKAAFRERGVAVFDLEDF